MQKNAYLHFYSFDRGKFFFKLKIIELSNYSIENFRFLVNNLRVIALFIKCIIVNCAFYAL